MSKKSKRYQLDLIKLLFSVIVIGFFVFLVGISGITKNFFSKPKAAALYHPGGLHTRKQIQFVINKISKNEEPWKTGYDDLISEANRTAILSPIPPRSFYVTPYYDNPTRNEQEVKVLTDSGRKAYFNALVYALSGSRASTSAPKSSEYAQRAISVLDAWANNNETISYSQAQLEMSTRGVSMILAAELLSDYPSWPGREKFKTWTRTVFLAQGANPIKDRLNNWGDWGILSAVSAYHFLDDPQGIQQEVERFKTNAKDSIGKLGEMRSEVDRGNRGIWYSYFALAPKITAATVIYNSLGVNLFDYEFVRLNWSTDPNGATTGIKKALDYLFTYSKDPASWPYYTGADLSRPTKGEWPGNLFEASGDLYGRSDYKDWVSSARPIFASKDGHHYSFTVPSLMTNSRSFSDAIVTTANPSPLPTQPAQSICYSTSQAWKNYTLPRQSSQFQVEFDITPKSAAVDTVVGLSAGTSDAFTDLAAIVRFFTTGLVDARNGSTYQALNPFRYSANVAYKVRMVVNPQTRTYSAFVRTGSGAETKIAENYKFRTEQSSLTFVDNLSIYTSSGSSDVCNLLLPSGPVPGTTRYISDMTWISSSNGWGPVERDRSNGEKLLEDGLTLSLRGVTYQKGLGTHSPSSVKVDLRSLGSCTFNSKIGVDDESGKNGSVKFEVLADGSSKYLSSIHRGGAEVTSVVIDLSNKSTLELITTDGGDGNGWDHADWADAKLICK